jgi:hypothetical protein
MGVDVDALLANPAVRKIRRLVVAYTKDPITRTAKKHRVMGG